MPDNRLQQVAGLPDPVRFLPAATDVGDGWLEPQDVVLVRPGVVVATPEVEALVAFRRSAEHPFPAAPDPVLNPARHLHLWCLGGDLVEEAHWLPTCS